MSTLSVTLTSPASPRLKHAHRILEDGKESCESFLTFYDSSIGRKRGAGSHGEQDLLRAMAVFAGATVDACLRIAVREVLKDFVEKENGVRGLLKASVKENLRGEDTKGVDLQFSAILDALFREDLSPVVEALSASLTGKGVQDQTRAKRMLKFVKVDVIAHWTAALEDALKARNDIVHELDARWSLSTGRGVKNRVQRRKSLMVAHAEVLLDFANKVLAAIDTEFAKL